MYLESKTMIVLAKSLKCRGKANPSAALTPLKEDNVQIWFFAYNSKSLQNKKGYPL